MIIEPVVYFTKQFQPENIQHYHFRDFKEGKIIAVFIIRSELPMKIFDYIRHIHYIYIYTTFITCVTYIHYIQTYITFTHYIYTLHTVLTYIIYMCYIHSVIFKKDLI